MNLNLDPLKHRKILSARFKVGYSFAESGINATELLLRLYLLSFYTDIVGISPFWAGLAGFIGLFWDAVTDPLMGKLSDRTLNHFKGRAPYLFLGTLILAASLILLFSPPSGVIPEYGFLYMLGSYLVLNTAMTVFSVPYMAMTSDLSQDRNERSVLFALRFAFGNLGALIAAGLPVYFLTSAQSPSEKLEAMSQVSWLLAALIILSGFTSWLTVRRKKHLLQNEKTEHWSDEFKSILTNQAFWPLLIAYTVATFGVSLNSSLARYYYRYRLMMDESEVGILLVSFMIFLTMSLMGWVWISKRFGKLIPLRYGILGLGIGTSVVYLLFQPGSFWTPLWVAGGLLGILVGSVVLLDSILTDVIDLHRVRGKGEAAGMYFGIWRFASKLSRASAFFAAGILLSGIGFVPNQIQEEEVSLALAWFFGPGVGIFLILSSLILIPYRFKDSKQNQVQRILQKRFDRAGVSV